MQQLTKVLDHAVNALDTVLLRLTTVRLLLASGKHEMVARGLEELDESIGDFEDTATQARAVLREAGYASFSDAAADLDVRDRVDIEHRLAAVSSLHRDVRVALSSTGGIAERAIRDAAEHVPVGSDGLAGLAPAGRRHPFLTGA